jgi:YHS domain-containing protein
MSTSKAVMASEYKKSTAELTRIVTLCGRIIQADPAYFPHTEYRGRTIYLCTEVCLGAFLADPDVLYKIHRNSEKKSV